MNASLAFDHSTQLELLLARLRAGDESARTALLERGLARFRALAGRMFRNYPDLRGIEQTDDVLQKAMLRLHRALAEVWPASVREFFTLAARQVRWVLLDLARAHAGERRVVYTGRQGTGHTSGSRDRRFEPADPAGEPGDLLAWSRFHEVIETLPAEVRETMDLLYYEGLSQEEASAALGISIRTMKRRWQSAKVQVQAALRGELPPM